MGTLTSYVGAIFVGRRGGKGSTGFSWINIKLIIIRPLLSLTNDLVYYTAVINKCALHWTQIRGHSWGAVSET